MTALADKRDLAALQSLCALEERITKACREVEYFPLPESLDWDDEDVQLKIKELADDVERGLIWAKNASQVVTASMDDLRRHGRYQKLRVRSNDPSSTQNEREKAARAADRMRQRQNAAREPRPPKTVQGSDSTKARKGPTVSGKRQRRLYVERRANPGLAKSKLWELQLSIAKAAREVEYFALPEGLDWGDEYVQDKIEALADDVQHRLLIWFDNAFQVVTAHMDDHSRAPVRTALPDLADTRDSAASTTQTTVALAEPSEPSEADPSPVHATHADTRDRRDDEIRGIPDWMESVLPGGYPLDFHSVVRHVATKLAEASETDRPTTIDEMATTYSHANPADLVRVASVHGVTAAFSHYPARRFLIERAVEALLDQVAHDGEGNYRLAVPFDDLRYQGRQLYRVVESDPDEPEPRRAYPVPGHPDLREDRFTGKRWRVEGNVWTELVTGKRYQQVDDEGAARPLADTRDTPEPTAAPADPADTRDSPLPAWRERYNARRRVEHQPQVCEECGATFLPRRADARTCSDRCRQARSRRTRGGSSS